MTTTDTATPSAPTPPVSVSHAIALRNLEITRIEDLGPRMRRLTLSGPQLDAFERDGHALPAFRSDGPDDHIKVFPPPADGSTVVLPAQDDGKLLWPADHSAIHRDYTVRRVVAHAGDCGAPDAIVVDFVLHEGGVAAQWATRVHVGDRLHVAGPRASTTLTPVEHLVLLGDATALPAIGRFIEEAPPATSVTALIEVVDAADEQNLHRPGGGELDITWVHRSAGDDLVTRAQALPELSDDPYVFIAGEHSLVRTLRRVFRDEHGLDRDRCRAAGYWRRGLSEHDAHVAGHEIFEMADLLTPYAVRAAAELRLADLIGDGADTVATLAARSGSDRVALAGIVEHLADQGVFTLGADATIGLTPRGDALRDDHPSGIRRRLDESSAHSRMDRAWAGLTHTLRRSHPSSGSPADTGYATVFGGGFWDQIDDDPAFAAAFDGAMAEWAYEWVPGVRDAHDWHRYRRIVDVGGGMGLLLGELLAVAPDATGAVVELAATVASARWWFDQQGLAGRAEAVEGSFFDPLPRADAIVLAQILHDWPDDDAVLILTRCAEALAGDDARVFVVDRCVDPDSARTGQAASVLRMRNLFGAKERSRTGIEALAAACGLRVVADTPSSHGLHVFELAPIDPVPRGRHGRGRQ